VLPTGASARAGGTRASDGRESLAEETRATAKGWLAATCDVVLSVPRARRASFHAPLCDADLAKCEFRDAVVDVAWQGASLPMAPLFSTQAALSTQATQASAHGALGSIAGTHMSHGTAQLASSASLASAPGAPGVLATPAMNVADGATFATQFGGASLTERSTGDFAGDFGAVVGATQAELPPWLRGSSGSGAGADADGTDAFPKTHYAYVGTNTRRRVVGGGGGPAADADAAAFSKASAAERRRRFERERALGRRRAVKLVRQYRAGELPDVRAATPAALLDPLAALARRDAETASALLTALLDAALESADAAERAGGGSVGEKRKATETYDAETTNAETTNAETNAKTSSTSSQSSLRDGVRDAIAALLPAASADETLAAWALRAAAADPEARFDADAVRAAAFDGGCLGSGVLALEARALHEARDDTKLHEISHSREVPSAEHRRRDAEVSLPKEKEKESSAEKKKKKNGD
jgi:hypothetical protein